MSAIFAITINTLNALRELRNSRNNAEQSAEQRNSLFRGCSAHKAFEINDLSAKRNNGTRFEKSVFLGAEQPSVCSALVPLTTNYQTTTYGQSGTTEQLEKKFPHTPYARAPEGAASRGWERSRRRAVPSGRFVSFPAWEMVAVSETVGHFAKTPAEAGLA